MKYIMPAKGGSVSGGKKQLGKILFIATAVLLLAAGCGKSQTATNTQVQQSTQIKATQNVQGGKPMQVFSFNAQDHKTAMDMLKSSYQVQTKSFGSGGEFVESIENMKPDSKHFWAFYVNGKLSNVGAGTYELKDGDGVEWKMETINNDQK
jgi:hypothetical protein